MADGPRKHWWAETPAGAPILLAFIKIDRVGSSLDRALPAEEALQRRARYTSGVEDACCAAAAAQPLGWQGDGVMIFLAGRGDELAQRAFRTARALRERVLFDLGLQVRVAVNVAEVAWNPDTGKLAHPAIDACGHLEAETPPDSIAVALDVYLGLSPGERASLAALGITRRDGTPTYVFPASAANGRQSDAFANPSDLDIWSKLRCYVTEAPEISRLRYVGFPLTRKEPPSLKLDEVFVTPSVTTRHSHELPPPIEGDSAALLAPWAQAQQAAQRAPAPLPPVLRTRRNLVVLGEPGIGKTTLVRWLALKAAQGALHLHEHIGVCERLVPLPVSIGRLAEVRRASGRQLPVLDAMAEYFAERSVGSRGELRDFLERRVAAGECWFLLDGLDEVPTDELLSTKTWLEAFVAQAAPRNRVIVTSRTVGYPGVELPSGHTVLVAPFDRTQVERYVEAFTRAYHRWENDHEDPEGARAGARDLLNALWSNPRLEALARNPFLLSALALVHRAEGRLPRHRVQVYDAVAGALCETWGSARRLAAGETHIELAYAVEALPIIGRLARRMQEEASSGTQTAEWVLDTLAATLTADRGVTPGEARRVAFEFLTRASRDVPILVERGAGRWGFLHLTFQEFFATAGLHATDEFEEVARQHLFDPRWEEVTRLGVGYLALVQNRPRAAARFVEHVFRETRLEDRPWLTEVLGKHVRLAALLASEAGEALSPALAHEIAGEAARWALRVPERLARAFLAESVLGDFGALVAEALIAVLERGDAGARGRAANALGALRSPAATSLRSSEDSRAVGSLVEALEGADERVAVAAASALGMVGGKAAEAALVARLTDERNGVRAFCALALGLADATTAVPALANTTRDGDHVVRVLGGLALGLLKAEGILLEAIRDPDEHVRSGAVLGVGSLRDEVAVSALTAAAGDPSPEVRVNVASGLHRFVAPGDPVSLLALLADTNPVVRARAAASLGRVGGPLAHERLVTALRDSEAAVRAAAAQSIGMLRVGAAVDPLGALIDDPSPEVRSAAALALGELGAASVAARLASLLSDHHATVRAAAVQALGKIVAPDFMAGLRASMTDADASVRLAAARALATSDPEAAARMLVALTTDPAGAQDLRDSAFLALWDLAGSGEGTP